MYRESNLAKESEISTVTLRNWVHLDNRANTEKYTSGKDIKVFPNDTENVSEGKNINNNNKANIKNIRSSINSGFAIESHPNIEALAHCLIEKLDTLQNTQVDIHHIEIITDRVFHSIEKLKHEIRGNAEYVQNLEHKNRTLEAKIDLLLSRNEAMIEHCTQIEAMCQSFFSKNIELENKLLAMSQKIYFSDVKENVSEPLPKTTTDLSENDDITEKKSYTLINETEIINTYSNVINSKTNIDIKDSTYDEEIDIKELMKSKNKVESFIKHNYPDDYKIMKQYNRKSVLNWVNKVLGLN